MVMINHELKIEKGTEKTIKELVLADNLVSERTIYRYGKNYEVKGATFPYVLDVNMCDSEIAYKGVDPLYMTMSDVACEKGHSDYEARLNRHLSEGWEIDPDKPDGHFRRKWDSKVYDSLALEPLIEINEEFIGWQQSWRCNDIPTIAISKRYPNIIFKYTIYSDGSYVGETMVQNGKPIKETGGIA